MVDKIDKEKVKTVSGYLIKPSNVADNDVVKKTVHDQLLKKINFIVAPWYSG